MFVRYQKTPKKSVKIVGFLQCSAHIVLGYDGRFWKINLRILWNHIMKNFQVKHGQCDSIIFLKIFPFENSKQLLEICLADTRIMYFWQVFGSMKTDEWCRIWKITDMWFGKWHEGFSKFLREYSKVTLLALWKMICAF